MRTVLGHFADRLFLSVKGVTSDGALTDADELEAEVKRAMIAQSEEAVLLVDESKLGTRGQNAIARVTEVSTVLAARRACARRSSRCARPASRYGLSRARPVLTF